jgi:hypothetical protein
VTKLGLNDRQILMRFLTRTGDILYFKASRVAPGPIQLPIQGTSRAVSLEVISLRGLHRDNFALLYHPTFLCSLPWLAEITKFDWTRLLSWTSVIRLGFFQTKLRKVDRFPSSVIKVAIQQRSSERTSLKYRTLCVVGKPWDPMFTYHIYYNSPSSDMLRRNQV